MSAIIAAKIIPCTLEFLDRMTIRCVEDYAHVGLPRDCAAVLLMETDGHPAAVADEAAQMESIARRIGASTFGPARDDAEALGSPRRGDALCRAGSTEADDDPRGRHRAAQRAGEDDDLHRRGRRRGTTCAWARSVTWATAICIRLSSPTNAMTTRCTASIAHDAIVTKTLELGGTITGEHGVGLGKKRLLRARSAMRASS